jgi:hypothetical protein
MLIFVLHSLTLTYQLLLKVLNRTGLCVDDCINYVMTLYHLFTYLKYKKFQFKWDMNL